MRSISNCVYCEELGRLVPAARDLWSLAPRCDLHWRYLCAICGKCQHFASVACTDEELFCSECAIGRRITQGRAELQSSISGSWAPLVSELISDQASEELPALLDARRDSAWHLTRCPSIDAQRWDGSHRSEDDVRQSWDENALAWSTAVGSEGDAQRRFISDPVLLARLGDVAGRRVLDAGAGNGYLSRKLARCGARVIALDISPAMAYAAETVCHGVDVSLVRGSATDLSQFDNCTFDAVVSNFVLMAIPDYELALREAFRVLMPGGVFVVCLAHPAFSCGPRTWLRRASDCDKLDGLTTWTVDHYFRRGAYTLSMGESIRSVPAYHRTLSDYWKAFDRTGFAVEAFDEPEMSLSDREHLPTEFVEAASRIPTSCVFTLRLRS